MEISFIKEKELNKLQPIKHGFISCGDIHAYNYHPYNDYSTIISSRLSDISIALSKVATVAKSINLPLILNGDLLTARTIDFPVEKVLTDFLSNFKDVKMYINLGNHDFDGSYSVLAPLIAYGKVKKHKAIVRPTIIKRGANIRFCFVPYCSINNTITAIRDFGRKLSKKTTNVLFVHNQFVNVKYPSNKTTQSGISQKLFFTKNMKKFDLIVASHIHKFQKICNGKGFYTSSLIPLDFGEKSKEHGFQIVDLDKKIIYFCIIKAPRFKTITTSKIKKFSKEKLKRFSKNNIIKIINDSNNIKNQLFLVEINKKIKKYGARHVIIKNKQKKQTIKESIIDDDNSSVDAIVNEYAKILSQNFNIDHNLVEKIGMDILTSAKKEIGGLK